MERELPKHLFDLDEGLQEVITDFEEHARIHLKAAGEPLEKSDYNELCRRVFYALEGFKDALLDYLDELEYDIGRN